MQRITSLAFGAVVLICWVSQSSYAGERDRIRYQQPHDVFYNYYVHGAGAVPAAMYPVPRPVPPHVGWTYYTYPPLYPHELMYGHQRAWYTYHPGAGWTRTKAYYHASPGVFDVLSHMRRLCYTGLEYEWTNE